MKPSLSVGRLATMALSLSPLAAALTWPRWLPDVDTLIVREQSSSSSQTTANSPANTPSPSPSTTPPPSSVSSKGKGSSKTSPTTGAASQTNLNTGGISQGNSSTTASNATHTIYPNEDPAGLVVMLTPAPTYQVTQLYKIGNYITWGWNYTNLQGTPTAVDVYVSCSTVSATWTLTQNMTFATNGAYTWDTGAYQATAVGDPLIVEQYTLVIIDADSSISATAEAGYLAPFTGFKFGLYTPRPYQDLDQWECATCSAALGAMERRAVGAAVAMSVVTVLSFTWFVAGFGAW